MRSRTIHLSLTLCLVSACLVGDEDDDADDELRSGTATLHIVQHNVEKKQDAIDKAIAEAKAIGAAGLTLQEVCPAQLAALRAKHGDWTIGSVNHKHPTLNGCDLPGGTHDTPTSVVIWTGGTGGKVTPYPDIAGPAGAPGNMVCVEFDRAKVPVHLCSVHLISADWTEPTTGIKYDGEEVRLRQTTKLKQIGRDEWFAGNRNHFGILGGDFNGKPATAPLDKLYDNRLGGSGEFTEYNRSGSSREGAVTATASGDNTTDGQPYSKKIDYIFFSTNRAGMDGPISIKPSPSDHDMLTSTVQMRK